MSDAQKTSSNLIRNNAIVENEWTCVTLPAGEETVRRQAGKVVLFKLTGEVTYTEEQIAGTVIPENGKIIVPLSVWLARKQELTQRLEKGELGIWLDTHELLEALVESVSDINRLPIIAVHVERFADGRIFSIGNLLRTRYGYRNELRAFGDVLRDQLFFLKRCGYDSYLIRPDRSAEDALASLQDFSQPYQGAVDETQPVWRRINRGVQ
ncbi:hypothetical protein MTYP_02265 [Methylophilaceae bacterium]|nr:hypothetical protein MTYP_02265 [Methylophilaceae bacterium]